MTSTDLEARIVVAAARLIDHERYSSSLRDNLRGPSGEFWERLEAAVDEYNRLRLEAGREQLTARTPSGTIP